VCRGYVSCVPVVMSLLRQLPACPSGLPPGKDWVLYADDDDLTLGEGATSTHPCKAVFWGVMAGNDMMLSHLLHQVQPSRASCLLASFQHSMLETGSALLCAHLCCCAYTPGMRNALAHDLTRRTGRWAATSLYSEVFLIQVVTQTPARGFTVSSCLLLQITG
jgi:hypothetical protein